MDGAWQRAALACAALNLGCIVEVLEPCESVTPGDRRACPVETWFDRAIDVRVPESWDGIQPLPLMYVFHGGGSNREGADKLTCPGGELKSEDCLTAVANRSGYVVVLPDGTGNRPLRNVRTWNAGGGEGQWECTSGAACSAGIDDMSFLDDVHALVERLLPIDANRIYATGISNGAAISHRYACERPQRLAAIAPVGGANQFAAGGGNCSPGVAVLQVHGTDDPCWGYDDEFATCSDIVGGARVSVDESMEGWRLRNGCDDATSDEEVPDTADDQTASTRIRWQGCDSTVELLQITGGGHTWPQGYQYAKESKVGRTAQDYDLDEILVEFFDGQSR